MDAGFRMDAGVRMDSVAVGNPKNMTKILRNWTNLGRVARVEFFRTIADSLAKTPPPLANPNPSTAAYETIVTTAEAALKAIADAEQALKVARQAATPAIDAAAAATETMARRCEDAFADNPAGATAVGFIISTNTPSPATTLGQPQDVTTSMNENQGAIDWHCHPVAGATNYELETTADPVHGPWARQESSTRSRGTITGLPSGTRIYLRVRANGPKGPGAWSDVSDRMVP